MALSRSELTRLLESLRRAEGVEETGGSPPLALACSPHPRGCSRRVDGVLRRSGIVISLREGSTVSYAPAGGDVAELLRAARRILTQLPDGQNVLLAELLQADASVPPLPTDNRG